MLYCFVLLTVVISASAVVAHCEDSTIQPSLPKSDSWCCLLSSVPFDTSHFSHFSLDAVEPPSFPLLLPLFLPSFLAVCVCVFPLFHPQNWAIMHTFIILVFSISIPWNRMLHLGVPKVELTVAVLLERYLTVPFQFIKLLLFRSLSIRSFLFPFSPFPNILKSIKQKEIPETLSTRNKKLGEKAGWATQRAIAPCGHPQLRKTIWLSENTRKPSSIAYWCCWGDERETVLWRREQGIDAETRSLKWAQTTCGHMSHMYSTSNT